MRKTEKKKRKKKKKEKGNLIAVWPWILSGAPGNLDAWPLPLPGASIPPLLAGGWPDFLGWGWRWFCSAQMVMCFSSLHPDSFCVQKWRLGRG